MTGEPQLRITVRFLQPYSHGRGHDGQPEWPPSPLRLFQALTASGLGREVVDQRRAATLGALRALERAPAPEIIAPRTVRMAPFRLFVPDNVGDRVANAWSAGRSADLGRYRTEKDVRALHLDGEAIHYIFKSSELASHGAVLQRLTHSLTHLGWGIDMVVGDARFTAEPVEGERWIPGRRGGITLRVPVEGTLADLERRHGQFLNRLDGGVFRPVHPLRIFRNEAYMRETDQSPRSFVAYRLLEPLTGDGLWFDPMARSRDVAAWVRHAVARVAADWPFGAVDSVVHGHRDEHSPRGRLSYMVQPTINQRLNRDEGIRRVMVAAPSELSEHIEWLGMQLGGEVLQWNGQSTAMLEPLPLGDWVLRQYIRASSRWATVTPIVLPGHDDASPRKSEALIRKAFLQAGFDSSIVDTIEELDWRKIGFIAGTEHANRYRLPDKVHGPAYHVRVRFHRPVLGPIAIGSGRFRGLGLFASRDIAH